MIELKDKLGDRADWILSSLSVLVLGSFWGLSEATLGGFLHAVHYPNAGPIMASIGMAIMGAHLGAFRRPALIPLIGVAAAMFKPLDGLVMGVSITSPFVVNPASAIVLEALAFGALAGLARWSLGEALPVRAVTYVGSGFAGFGLYAMFASWQGFGRWPAWTLSEKFGQVWHDGGLAGLIGMAFALTTYALAAQGRSLIGMPQFRRPNFAYGGAVAIVAACWLSAFAVFKTGAFGN